MRLLSFLSEIERAIVVNTPAAGSSAWDTARMVNFQQGIARLTLSARNGFTTGQVDGAIFLQGFALADGSVCLKASLTWKGSDSFPAIAIYTTPSVNWAKEACRVASAWLEGPAMAASSVALPEQDVSLVAEAS